MKQVMEQMLMLYLNTIQLIESTEGGRHCGPAGAWTPDAITETPEIQHS